MEVYININPASKSPNLTRTMLALRAHVLEASLLSANASRY
jgi:hypothetical protein